MSHVSDLIATDIREYLHRHEKKSLLRFITCGSVDDGKSTVIGRLLYESKMVFEDQLAAIEADSRKWGTQGGDIDFALLVDGLAAEREQGITIDVAYRFFSTDQRKFIVADTPGHEQYTRNMVTGASTADVAVILIDARKGVLTQTRRHSYLVSLIGIRKVVLAINKMDLVGYAEAVCRKIDADYRAFAAQIGLTDITTIPLSALKGDNMTSASQRMPWYDGPYADGLPGNHRDRRDAPAGGSPCACRCNGSTAPTSTSAAFAACWPAAACARATASACSPPAAKAASRASSRLKATVRWRWPASR